MAAVLILIDSKRRWQWVFNDLKILFILIVVIVVVTELDATITIIFSPSAKDLNK